MAKKTKLPDRRQRLEQVRREQALRELKPGFVKKEPCRDCPDAKSIVDGLARADKKPADKDQSGGAK